MRFGGIDSDDSRLDLISIHIEDQVVVKLAAVSGLAFTAIERGTRTTAHHVKRPKLRRVLSFRKLE
jgi:hypothetical protein